METVEKSMLYDENYNYDTLLIPVYYVKKTVNIIIPNDMQMYFRKNMIDTFIESFESSICLKLYYLYANINASSNDNVNGNIDVNENVSDYKLVNACTYRFLNMQYWEGLADSSLKLDKFIKVFTTMLETDDVTDIVVIGYKNIDFNDFISSYKHNNKKIFYICLNNNNYDIYVDGVFVNTYEDDLLHFIMNDYLSIGLTLNLHNENINIYNLGNLYQNKYYCLGTFDKNIDSYKFNNKLISLDKSVNIDINDKNIIIMTGFLNMLLVYNKKILCQHIYRIKSIIKNKIIKEPDPKLYNKIMDEYIHLLITHKENKIDNDYNSEIKSEKINKSQLLLLKDFAKNVQFKFQKNKYEIKQNNNVIKNIETINMIQDKIIKWESMFSKYDFINPTYDNSLDMYNLLLSRTDWHDELKDGNIIGILLCINSPKLAKLGLSMNRIEILNLSNNFVSFEQVCEAQNIYKKTNDRLDDGRVSTKYAIFGNCFGFGNGMLPLYINKIHWSLSTIYMNYCLGMLINQNPFDYYNKFYEIYSMTLLKYIENMISDRTKINDKDIIVLIQLIITNNIIFRDIFKYKINNKYSLVECIIKYDNIDSRFENTIDNNDFLLGNTVITNNKIISNNIHQFKSKIKLVFNEEIRRNIVLNNISLFDFEDIPFDKLIPYILKTEYLVLSKNLSMDYHIIKYLSIHSLKYMMDIDNSDHHNFIIDMFILIIENCFNNIDTINTNNKPISKILSWYLINELNNDETIKHINNILDDKYGNIDDKCIAYFKLNLIRLNNKYKEFYNADNKLLFLEIDDNIDIRCASLYLENLYIKHKNNLKNNIYDNNLCKNIDVNELRQNIKKYIKQYINNLYNDINKMESNIKNKYIEIISKYIKENGLEDTIVFNVLNYKKC
jgi:hypothetical protein